VTPQSEDIDPAKIDPMASPGPPDDVPSPSELPNQGDGDNDESFPEEAQAPGSQTAAGQSVQVDAESDDSFPASDPPGNY